MKKLFKELKKNILGYALLTVALGIVFCVWTEDSAKVICMVFGALLIANGVIQALETYKKKKLDIAAVIFYLASLLMIILGIFILIKPDVILEIIATVLGIVMIIQAAVNLKLAISLKKLNYKRWALVLAVALLIIVFGVLCITNPMETIMSIYLLVGICLILDGLGTLWILFTLASCESKAKDIIK